jgi:hypothetical protein
MKFKLKEVSATKVTTYTSCPFRFYLNYVLGLRMPKNTNLVIGSAVHEGIKRLLLPKGKIGLDDYTDAFGLYKQVWKNEKDTILAKDDKDIESSFALGESMLEKFYLGKINGDFKFNPTIFKDPYIGETPAVEIEFKVPMADMFSKNLNSIKLVGKIDVAGFDKDGEFAILDHKTASRGYSTSKIERDLQLPFYLIASSILVGQGAFPNVTEEPKKVMFGVMLKTKTAISSKNFNDFYQFHERILTEQELNEYYTILDTVVKCMKKGPYFPSVGMQCDTMCSHAGICSAAMKGGNPITAHEEFLKSVKKEPKDDEQETE